MFWSYTLSILLLGCGMLLMFVVLLQRGRGGGLAGAFGGAGGQSALGTKAGDVFTKITIILAGIWVVLAGVTGLAMQKEQTGRFPGGSESAPENPELQSTEDGGAAGADTDAAPAGDADADAAGGGPALSIPETPATEGEGAAAAGEADTPAEADNTEGATPPAGEKPATPPAGE